MRPKARSREERDLAKTQRAVTLGQLADVERKALIVKLFDGGMTQRGIAELLTHAAVAAGGTPIGEDAVSHIVRRYRD